MSGHTLNLLYTITYLSVQYRLYIFFLTYLIYLMIYNKYYSITKITLI